MMSQGCRLVALVAKRCSHSFAPVAILSISTILYNYYARSMPAQSLSIPAFRCGGLPTRLGPSRAAPFRCQQPHAAIRPAAPSLWSAFRRTSVAPTRSTGSDGDKGETRPGQPPAEDTAAQTKTADAASGPGDGDSGMLRGLDGVGAGGTGGAANEDRRQQAAEAVAARLRQEVEPVTRALAGVQDTLQELANQQARLVQQHEQQAQEDQQQQQPVQDPNRRPIWSVNGINNNDVTQLREALQQHHGEVQRELVERLGAQGRELPAAVALAVQQQMGRRDVATGALLGAAVVLGYGLGRREGNSSDSSGSGPVTPGEGGVGPVKYKAAGESGGAGRVSVPPRATTSDEMELLKQCDSARPDMDVVRQLLAAGTAVNVSDKDGYSPLEHAASWDHVELVVLLLAAGANPRCCEKNGFTPLHVAKSRLVVEQLVGAGAPLEARSFEDGWTPLHNRVMYGFVEAAEALIQAGADISAQYSPGKTPLHLAARKGQFEVARLLLRYGADVDAKDGNGETPLMRAELSSDRPTIRLLRKAEAEAEATRKAEAQAKADRKVEAEADRKA